MPGPERPEKKAGEIAPDRRIAVLERDVYDMRKLLDRYVLRLDKGEQISSFELEKSALADGDFLLCEDSARNFMKARVPASAIGAAGIVQGEHHVQVPGSGTPTNTFIDLATLTTDGQTLLVHCTVHWRQEGSGWSQSRYYLMRFTLRSGTGAAFSRMIMEHADGITSGAIGSFSLSTPASGAGVIARVILTSPTWTGTAPYVGQPYTQMVVWHGGLSSGY